MLLILWFDLPFYTIGSVDIQLSQCFYYICLDHVMFVPSTSMPSMVLMYIKVPLLYLISVWFICDR